MLKNFSKFLLIILVLFVVTSSSLICFADEKHDHTTTTETDTTNETTSTEEEIHEGDLYIFDNNIIMNKYVDGNAFLFGNNIEITGKVNGNLFVFGNNIKFNGSVVRYSTFVCANSVYYNAYSGTEYDYGNLYVAARNFESTYDSYVTGNIKAISSNIILKCGVYRNAELICNTINFGSGEDIPIIFGNLDYTANKEVIIPENVLAGHGNVTYTSTYNIENILIYFGTLIVTVLGAFTILSKLTPKFIEKIYDKKFSIISLLKVFGIGLATIAIVTIFVILLAGTMVGIPLAIILALLFAILCIIAPSILTIKITNTLKPILKIEKISIFYVVIILVSIILHGITLIPYAGGILGLIINITAIGLIITVFLPHKELTEEEKLALEEAKKQARENKEKRKQENLEAKTAKKDNKNDNKSN